MQTVQKDTQFKFKNYCETLVLDRIKSMPDLLAKGDDFVNDVACMALNRLKPRYVREKIYLFYYAGESDWKAMNAEVAEAVDFAVRYVEQHTKHP
jgi:hypothetical protein